MSQPRRSFPKGYDRAARTNPIAYRRPRAPKKTHFFSMYQPSRSFPKGLGAWPVQSPPQRPRAAKKTHLFSMSQPRRIFHQGYDRGWPVQSPTRRLRVPKKTHFFSISQPAPSFNRTLSDPIGRPAVSELPNRYVLACYPCDAASEILHDQSVHSQIES